MVQNRHVGLLLMFIALVLSGEGEALAPWLGCTLQCTLCIFLRMPSCITDCFKKCHSPQVSEAIFNCTSLCANSTCSNFISGIID